MAKKPELWPIALRQWRALTPRGWWRRWPPVPGPSPEYKKFRLVAMYGSSDAELAGDELVQYLEWCRWMRPRAR